MTNPQPEYQPVPQPGADLPPVPQPSADNANTVPGYGGAYGAAGGGAGAGVGAYTPQPGAYYGSPQTGTWAAVPSTESSSGFGAMFDFGMRKLGVRAIAKTAQMLTAIAYFIWMAWFLIMGILYMAAASEYSRYASTGPGVVDFLFGLAARVVVGLAVLAVVRLLGELAVSVAEAQSENQK